MLAAALAELEELGPAGGGAVGARARREALAAYAGFGPERAAFPPTWRHDYAALPFEDLAWSTGRARVPALPAGAAPARRAPEPGDQDVPALAVENAGGLLASVGALDEDALLYVQSRGIARGVAERMMSLAFFEPAISGFPSEAIRDEVRTALDARLDEIPETFAS